VLVEVNAWALRLGTTEALWRNWSKAHLISILRCFKIFAGGVTIGNTFRSKQYTRTKNKKHLVRQLFCKYAYKARIREIEFKLTFEQFKVLIFKNCYLCGSPPSNLAKRKSIQGQLFYSGIDRLDNSKGYIIENVRPACHKCNAMKSSMTMGGFKKQIKKILTFGRGAIGFRKKAL